MEWHDKYEHCITCKKTKFKHTAGGRCSSCYTIFARVRKQKNTTPKVTRTDMRNTIEPLRGRMSKNSRHEKLVITNIETEEIEYSNILLKLSNIDATYAMYPMNKYRYKFKDCNY